MSADPGASPATSALVTDLYQLTMLQSYWQQRMLETAVFEFFVRRLPAQRNFLLAAGLEQTLDYLESLRFLPQEIDWLRSTKRFEPGFLDWLASFRFRGEVHAMLEGTVFFENEPILRVTASFPEAQFVESRLINILHFQTLIASKSARMVLMQPNAQLIDFGLRRAHGAEAGLFAARASYLAGFAGTATLQAERLYGVPVFGTMAHSFVQAHANEREAFLAFATSWPKEVYLLIDTYDTEAAAHTVVSLSPELARRGIRVKGVRLDSGDLIDLSKRVRRILDAGGLPDAKILASSNIDEYYLAEAADAGAPIDAFGIGTHLATSADAPYLDCAYKLQEYAGQPRRKRSTGKATWPGRKQVYRRYGEDGRMLADTLTVEMDEPLGQALISPVMTAGHRVRPAEPLAASRQRAADSLARLPNAMRGLERAPAYPVTVSAALKDLAVVVDSALLRSTMT